MLCGCSSCALQWIAGGGQLKSILEKASCAQLQSILKGAFPPLALRDGDLCSAFISSLQGVTIEHLQVDQSLDKASSCPASAAVNLSSTLQDDLYMLPFPLSFDKTSATCMDAPYMN